MMREGCLLLCGINWLRIEILFIVATLLGWSHPLSAQDAPGVSIREVRQAAKKGHPDAQYMLGVAYAEGEGVKQNIAKAVKWWTKAAEQGEDRAQYILSFCYSDGEGVPQDNEEAIRWLKESAINGNPIAQTEVL